MRRKLRRLLCTVLAMIMALSLPMAVFAEEADPTYEIEAHTCQYEAIFSTVYSQYDLKQHRVQSIITYDCIHCASRYTTVESTSYANHKFTTIPNDPYYKPGTGTIYSQTHLCTLCNFYREEIIYVDP